ncbi:glycosyltransferase [Nocardia sp. BMG111209]|uniref:glycosyltransferase n=1 Tax=Nocardia sp. BMG111209 TaxID=1160137 RepID=UPI000378F264|nr:glycosyltransferase [Nocardia sp. BMG111209]
MLAGGGGCEFTAAMVRDCAGHCAQFRWRTLGLDRWVADPWPWLCEADLVVAHAGQGAVADIAAAGTPAILIPAARPFGEQHATARAVAAAGPAVTTPRWPATDRWPGLIEQALALDGRQWTRWQVRGAPERAAAVIAAVAGR